MKFSIAKIFNFSDMKTKAKILIGIGSPLVLLVILATISVFSINTINRAGKLVEHTHEVLAEAEEVIAHAVDMETGMRGYLLAGQEDFLAPYIDGEEKTYATD